MQQPKLPKLARAFLEQAGAKPQLLEVKACGSEYGRPGPRNMHDGVAIVDVSGVLTAGDWWWGSTYSEIRRDIQAALDSDECKGILLRIDSPGGGTDEAFETASFVAEAAQKKPIWAVADVNCYSAAYLLASQCSKVIAAPDSGGVGSIGVYGAHVDYSGALDEAGIKITLVSAGKGKTDGNPYEPLSDDAKATFQAEVDRQYDLFVGAVARGRKISEKGIREMGAALQHGRKNAIASGLADDAMTFDEALVAMITKVNTDSTISASALAAASSPKGADMAEHLKAGATANAEEETKPEAKKKADEGEDEEDKEMKGMAVAEEIADMCAMAGISGKTSEMIGLAKSGTSMADIRKRIIDAKADASSEEIRTSASVGAKPKTNLLNAAVDQMAGLYKSQARMQEGK